MLRPRSRETNHKPCARCAELKLRRKQAATFEELQAIALELGQHRDDISADRRVYKHICTLCEKATGDACTMQDPTTSYQSCVIDGMDQSKFQCPRNIAASKLWDKHWRPQLGFIGVLVHGVCEIFYVLEPGLQKSGSTIVEVLARSLEKVKDILAQRLLVVTHLFFINRQCALKELAPAAALHLPQLLILCWLDLPMWLLLSGPKSKLRYLLE